MKIIFFLFFMCLSTVYGQETGTFTDSRDGKVYKTVKIGKQIWFAQNLAYKPDSGYYLSYKLNKTDYWFYKKDSLNLVSESGYLYNWETAKKVCPKGWHLPSDSDWKQLIDFLGGNAVAGCKLKAKTDWLPYNGITNTNESKFNALPTGKKTEAGYPDNLGGYGSVFWSSSILYSPRSLTLDNSSCEIKNVPNNALCGCSVRCVKD